MASVPVPYTFANQAGSIPLSELDANFAAIPSNTTPGPIGSVTPSTGAFTTLTTSGNAAIGGTLTGTAAMFSPITNALSGNVALNNTGQYFDGPSIAQGAVGTWLVFGTVTVTDSGTAASLQAKLWDGTTVIASTRCTNVQLGQYGTMSLSGFITAPAGNLRISVNDASATTGSIVAAAASVGNNSSTITAIRIG